MSKQLYHERIDNWDSSPGDDARVVDYVEVWVRYWDAGDTMTPDVVIGTMVMVDREIVVDSLKAHHAWEHNEAYWIRQGIRAFDELAAAHPTLATAPLEPRREQGPTWPGV